MKINATDNVSNVEELEDLASACGIFFQQVKSVINGAITFNDNISNQILSMTFAGSGVALSVNHSLRRVPAGYIQVGASAGITVYDGNGLAKDTISLRATGAGTVKVMVF